MIVIRLHFNVSIVMADSLAVEFANMATYLERMMRVMRLIHSMPVILSMNHPIIIDSLQMVVVEWVFNVLIQYVQHYPRQSVSVMVWKDDVVKRIITIITDDCGLDLYCNADGQCVDTVQEGTNCDGSYQYSFDTGKSLIKWLITIPPCIHNIDRLWFDLSLWKIIFPKSWRSMRTCPIMCRWSLLWLIDSKMRPGYLHQYSMLFSHWLRTRYLRHVDDIGN
jgi:hypothetical protein